MYNTIKIRPAIKKDYSQLEYFLRNEFFVHQHLDWRPVLEWLGFQPFFVAEIDGEIIACLAAPIEVEKVAWIRLFACSSLFSRTEIWKLLFEELISSYQKEKIDLMVVLGIHQWFNQLLLDQKFRIHQHIVVFEWFLNSLPVVKTIPELQIRPLESKNIKEVALLDKKCFDSLWQLPENSMEKAYQQSGYSTIAIIQEKIIAYQMSTETNNSAHLARLAVDPLFQGKNIGKSLLVDLFSHYNKREIYKITVNTQDDNLRSQALYNQMGFTKTSDKYPVLIKEF